MDLLFLWSLSLELWYMNLKWCFYFGFEKGCAIMVTMICCYPVIPVNLKLSPPEKYNVFWTPLGVLTHRLRTTALGSHRGWLSLALAPAPVPVCRTLSQANLWCPWWRTPERRFSWPAMRWDELQRWHTSTLSSACPSHAKPVKVNMKYVLFNKTQWVTKLWKGQV